MLLTDRIPARAEVVVQGGQITRAATLQGAWLAGAHPGSGQVLVLAGFAAHEHAFVVGPGDDTLEVPPALLTVTVALRSLEDLATPALDRALRRERLRAVAGPVRCERLGAAGGVRAWVPVLPARLSAPVRRRSR